ncbi:hypothetical protein TSUD_250230 [Trifolium subterraneum]|nr:hypothetical protein TSUD_250230 [Trifolium subterraneum]
MYASCSYFSFKTESWKNSTDCCEWDGVTCDNVLDYVIGLDLSCNNLEGELHPNSSIFQLRHLRQLNLAFNDFSGSSISVGIGDLVNLTDLDLSYCGLIGNIPSTISQLSKLVSLNLGGNWMELNPFTWKKLIHNATNLRNWPSDILSLPNLEGVELSSNQYLSGQLPKSNWSTPLRLDLSNNHLKGLLLGYIVFFVGKPQWIVRHVEHMFNMRLKRTNNKAGANRRRIN